MPEVPEPDHRFSSRPLAEPFGHPLRATRPTPGADNQSTTPFGADPTAILHDIRNEPRTPATGIGGQRPKEKEGNTSNPQLLFAQGGPVNMAGGDHQENQNAGQQERAEEEVIAAPAQDGTRISTATGAPLRDDEAVDPTPLLSAARATRGISPDIDASRLLDELGISEEDLKRIAELNLPPDNAVASRSPIKVTTGSDTLQIVQPGKEIEVDGEPAPSGVVEQPIGQEAIDGAWNRLFNLGLSPRVGPRTARYAVENGLFRIGPNPTIHPTDREGVVQFTEGADLTVTYDDAAEYEDRAVVAVSIPGHPPFVQISPASEAVPFPKGAVQAAYDADGGFLKNTAGAMLKERGLVDDKQNPHKELTADRAGGPLPRQDQMARAIARGLVKLANGTVAEEAEAARERRDRPVIVAFDEPDNSTPPSRESQHPGGHMRESTLGPGYTVEVFETRTDARASLATGTQITLPYTYYEERLVTPGNNQSYGLQRSVEYDSLSDAEREAVAIAMGAQDRGAYRTETFPYYHRLALRQGENGTPDQVYTVAHRDGFNMGMEIHPDSQNSLDDPVAVAEPVRDGFVVTPYRGGYMYEATYRDPELNFFGPQDEFANAFWISGNPRTVYSNDPRLMREVPDSLPDPRFTIFRVRWYKVLTQKKDNPEADVVL